MIWFFLAVTGIHVILTLIFIIGWVKTTLFLTAEKPEPPVGISVIIPVRNEAENIINLLKDLSRQEYPQDHFEVIIIDDHSDDNTLELVNRFAVESVITVKFVSLKTDNKIVAHKKRAVKTGIEHAAFPLIVTTDGDCRAGSKWLKTISDFYRKTEAKMICGPVRFHPVQSFFEKLQAMEFAGLIGAGAASLKHGFPNMCNGANLIYEKAAFYAVNGFEGIDSVASGDDELLMHKVYKKFPKKVKFLKAREAVIDTRACAGPKEFFRQRRRWAGKWGVYNDFRIKLLAFFIFASNISLLAHLALVLFVGFSPMPFFILFSAKAVIELIFLTTVLRFFKIQLNPLLFFLFQLVYPFYIPLISIMSNLGQTEWKGRKLK